MSRKLIHSIRAIVVSFGVLAAVATIGLPSAVVVPPQLGATAVAVAIAEPAVAPSIDSGVQTAAPKSHAKRRRLPREEMSLPFFSFAHGLRPGNGG